MLRLVKGSLCALALAGLGGCAGEPSVQSAIGGDNWSRKVSEIWLPETRQAMVEFDRIARQMSADSPARRPAIIVASSAERAEVARKAHPEATVVQVLESGKPQVQSEQAIRIPLKKRAEALLDELTAGHAARIPVWLHQAYVAWVVNTIQEKVETTRAGDWERQTESAVRKADSPVSVAQVVAAGAGGHLSAPELNLASEMIRRLQLAKGEPFPVRLGQYFRAAGRDGFDADQAFVSSFGMSRAAFVSQMDAYLMVLRGEIRHHGQAVPPASGFATINEEARFPLQAENLRNLYERYRRARPPKALAISQRRMAAAFVEDSAEAMALAMRNCEGYDKASCRLYAVDDVVVYAPPVANHAGVTVLLKVGDMDNWARQVQERWLPMVEEATTAFNQLFVDRTGSGLSETVVMYVAPDQAAYRSVLGQELGLLQEAASEEAGISGGMSVGKGLIALPLPETLSEGGLRERALKTNLHELTHEMQDQLSKGQKARAPRWMLEGTADLMGFSVAGKLPGGIGADFTLQKWHDRNLGWYRTTYNGIRPEEMMKVDHAGWTRMMKYKLGPYQMAGLMAEYLMISRGDDFYAEWVNYFKALGQRGAKEPEAFAANFGVSEDEFLAGFKVWLKAL